MKFATSRLVIAAFGLAAAMALGCGGGSDGGMIGSQDANVTGTWVATLTVTGGTQGPPGTQFAAVFTLAQSGTRVTGTFATAGGGSGVMSGTVAGQAFSFNVAQNAPCAGTYSGSATVNGAETQLTGGYSGSDCNGTLQISAVATKQ
jgi:hypothetical protein